MKAISRTAPISLAIAILALTVATASQNVTPTQVAEMKKLDFLVGEWKGEGWVFNPTGTKSTSFVQKTKVQAKEGNATLRIQDEKSYKPSNGMLSNSLLDTTLTYDETSKLYHWRAEGVDATIEVKLLSDRKLQYGMPFSVTIEPKNGYRKTTIEINEKGEWHELLELWNEYRWFKFEESILKRVK